MTAQLIPSLPWLEYAVPGFLGSSALADWPEMSHEAWSAKYLEKAYEGGGTPAMVAGSALDALLTDPTSFAGRFSVAPEGLDGRTKEGKAWKAENAGRDILTADAKAEIDATLPRVREAIEAMRPEGETVHYQTTIRGAIAGMQVQTRPDIQIGNHFPDLKYLNPMAFSSFDRHFWGSRYMFQAGLFFGLAREAGIESPRVSFLLAESGTLMPRIEVVEIDESALMACWTKSVERVEEIRDAIASPLGLVDCVKFRRIDLPVWAQKAIEG
jgi:hypothetical protein